MNCTNRDDGLIETKVGPTGELAPQRAIFSVLEEDAFTAVTDVTLI